MNFALLKRLLELTGEIPDQATEDNVTILHNFACSEHVKRYDIVYFMSKLVGTRTCEIIELSMRNCSLLIVLVESEIAAVEIGRHWHRRVEETGQSARREPFHSADASLREVPGLQRSFFGL